MTVRAVRFIFHSLGSVAVGMKDSVLEPILRLLGAPSHAVRIRSGQCLRMLERSVPSQLATLLRILMSVISMHLSDTDGDESTVCSHHRLFISVLPTPIWSMISRVRGQPSEPSLPKGAAGKKEAAHSWFSSTRGREVRDQPSGYCHHLLFELCGRWPLTVSPCLYFCQSWQILYFLQKPSARRGRW